MSKQALNEIRSCYRAWDRGKGSTGEQFVELMADDGSFRSIGAGAEVMAFTRDHKTKDRVRAYFKELDRDWEMIFYNVRNFLAQRNTVAVVCECAWKHKHTGKVVHSPKLDIMRLKKGRIFDFFEFFDNHQAYAACVEGGTWPIAARPTPLYGSAKSRTVTGVAPAAANNVKALKKLYAQWHKTKGASADQIVGLLAADVIWGSLSSGADPVAFTKTHMSREEVGNYFRGLADSFQMNYYNVNEYVAAGPYVLVLADVSFTNKKTGKSFASPKADLWRFNRGKATEFYEYYDTAAVMATTA